MPGPENPPSSGASRRPVRRAALCAAIVLFCPPHGAPAGDLLRGGAPANTAPTNNSSATSGAAAAAQAQSNAQDALARTARAIQSVQQLQNAARNAAAAGPNNLGADPNHPGSILPNVPNGLAPGGLQYVSGTGVAGAPSQGAGGAGVQVTVTQTAQQAVLNWSSFNIGKNTTLYFNQSAGGAQVSTWVAFNLVKDPSGVPSQILGSIIAPGQVYVINQNGIIFGGTSQVNVHTLVASSLPINSNLISRGLLNNPDAQFLFSGLAQPAGTKGPTPAFAPPTPGPPNGMYGNVTVQAGAQLTAPTSADNVGGRIALVGANVTNAGSISTPDGQTILAAGLQVGFDSSSDPSLRGLVTYVGQVGAYAGTATNRGLITSPRGDVTITGKNVNQLGAINSSTSVSFNGRVDLLANYNAVSNTAYDPVKNPGAPPFLYKSSGAVTLGSGSAIQILPEWSSAATVTGTELALRSEVNMQGNTVYAAPGSSLVAPNAVVNINAGVWNYIPSNTNPQSTFVNSGGQVYLDAGSMFNVAGSTGITAPLSEYILQVTLRGAELANSPLERTSIFRPGDGTNPTITVDLRKTGTYNGVTWVGTPLANLTSYLGLVERTVGELTVAGGSVNISAGGSVVVQHGASIDVSGGYVTYGSGMVQTTRVMYAGHLMDIADATPNRLYQGIFTGIFTESHPAWGITENYTVPWMLGTHFEQSYIQGADGGSLSFTAPAMALDGDFTGNTISGPRQRTVAAAPSSFSTSFVAQEVISGSVYTYSPTPPTVVFGSGSLAPADPFAVDGSGNPLPLRSDRQANVILSPTLLTTSGFGSLTVNNPDGSIIIPAGVSLAAAARGQTTTSGLNPNGSISLTGSNVILNGTITAPGGTVTIQANDVSLAELVALQQPGNSLQNPPADPTRGLFSLGSGASINTAGLIVDDRLSSAGAGTGPMTTAGGNVAITALSANLAAGSLIDVSGGVAISPTGKLTYGNGGSISILAGKDPNLSAVAGGHLTLKGVLEGYSGAVGASLAIQAPLIQVGGHTSNPDELLLDPEFFSTGGFTSFTLTGLGAPSGQPDQYIPAVYIAPGTIIEPVAEKWVTMLNGAAGGATLIPALFPEGMRTPVSLSFGALGITNSTATNTLVARGDIVMGAGALIRTDAGASVAFSGQTVAIYGDVFAPGGAITISAGALPHDSTVTPTSPYITVYLGPQSVLSTAGKVVIVPDGYGRQTGTVYPGGTVAIAGNIYGAPGSVIDVSGTSGILDLPPSVLGLNGNLSGPQTAPLVPLNSGLNQPLYSLFTVPTRVDSNGGSIILKGKEGLLVDSTLLGFAGGPTALGGSLQVSSGSFVQAGAVASPTAISLTVTQTTPAISLAAAGIALPGPGQGYFTADSFLHGGFDSLSLGGNMGFTGPVNITARGALSVGSGGIIAADSPVTLTAAYIQLGMPFIPPFQPQEQKASPFSIGNALPNAPPIYGSGSLTAIAPLIDVGTLSLQGIGKLSLIADNGDIRGNGTLDVAGSIYIRAGQVYPTTASAFTIAAYDYTANGQNMPGSVTIVGSGNRDLPLSAGGQLNIYASNIYQGGVLRAPLGSINIGWDGTGTAPVDFYFTGNPFPISQQVTIASGSITDVSAVKQNGLGLLIPYGFSPDGTTWIDPTGVDITASGFPTKGITISGVKVTTQPGSKIDLSGGGDVYAYQWVPGNGGSTDILASSTSFAVIPGYNFNYAPYAPFNTNGDPLNLASSNPGYVNASLHVGDQIYLNGSGALAAGVYTLLPARYALLPGAVLVTPQSGNPIGTFAQPDGSYIVSGYEFNSLNSVRTPPGLYSRFEVDPAPVVRARSQYVDLLGSTALAQGAAQNNLKAPRLPQDAGHLILEASQSLVLQGSVNASASAGLGGLVDISTPQNIVITGPDAVAPAGSVVLDSANLSSFGAASLLIGGVRQVGSNGTTVSVATNSITVNNAGAPLSSPEVILVSNQTLTLSPSASVVQSGTINGEADTLLLGSATTPGSGNGTLLRVSSDPTAQIIRSGVTQPNNADMVIGAGAQISGTSITLDSTYATQLSPLATLHGQVVNLNSGQISLQLDSAVSVTANTTGGLVLAGPALQSLQGAQALALLSYSSLDTYGDGTVGSSAFASLALHTAEIRGFGTAGGTVTFAAKNILLDNSANGSVPGSAGATSENLVFNGGVITLGANNVAIDQFAGVQMNAGSGLLTQSTGSLTMPGSLTITAPVIAGGNSSTYSMVAGKAVVLQPSAGPATIAPGLGASLTVQGTSVNAGTAMSFPSGTLTLHATTGNLVVSGKLDASGTAQTFFDLVKYTSGGQVTLASDNGQVDVTGTGSVNVSAQPGGGNAGTVNISAPRSQLVINGAILGQAGQGGSSGTLSIDAGSLPGGLLSSFSSALTGFQQSVSVRDRLDTTVTVDGSRVAHTFNVSSDNGSIVVTGTVDASGPTGGSINLVAADNVILSSNSLLTVAAQNFDAAGKGGSVSLEAGSAINGVANLGAYVDIQANSTINLSVASVTASSAGLGQFQGTLHIRQPQDPATDNIDVVKPIDGNIVFNPVNPSLITFEGYALFQVTGADGIIDSTVQGNILSNGNSFGTNAGSILSTLTMHNASLASSTYIIPGAEVFNLNGNLTLGSPTSDTTSDWDLSGYRSGTNGAPGVLTLRASGNLVFYNALTDGFVSVNTSTITGLPTQFDALLSTQNPALPTNLQSWSYQMSAGADFSAADFHMVLPTASLPAGSGSLLLGKNGGLNLPNSPSAGADATTPTALDNLFQVIRTGTGNIDISTGRDVQLLNQFATIYTAGVQIADPTLGGTFDTPVPDANAFPVGTLGAPQQNTAYPAQYAYAGGNVTIKAQGDIIHLTQNSTGTLVADSERELPVNWLYRRGYVDPLTGAFGYSPYGEVASTTWWVDYSNFFEGVGALGGGNVTMLAGHDISNVDAVVPTNALMPGKDSGGNPIAPNAASLIELGGGNLVVSAGNNINGGAYYVERGQGTLSAGGSILTNATRSPSLTTLSTPSSVLPSQTWLPTTLFVGDSTFNVSARNDVLLGPVATTFLLPQGYSNTYSYKTYFSTYGADSGVSVSSLGGSITFRESVSLPLNGSANAPVPTLEAWLQNELLFATFPATASDFLPWLRLDESSVLPFAQTVSIMAPTLQATAFSGNINLVGGLTLFPSPTGTLSLVAAGTVNGLQPDGVTTIKGTSTNVWATSTINVSDANPASIPGPASPFAYQSLYSNYVNQVKTNASFLNFIGKVFAESGSTTGIYAVNQTKQALHDPGLLHAGDTLPVYVYAGSGDISGLTLYSSTSARIMAGNDITDVALYLQNNNADDISVVSAGRNIVAYDANSVLRSTARSSGNVLAPTEPAALAGDIQINGPGTLEVLAGGNLDLGTGGTNANGTGTGITSIGNERNPYLPFGGASVIVGAGLGGAGGLNGGALDFQTFISQIVNGADGTRYFSELSAADASLGALGNLTSATFAALPASQQDLIALDIFFLALRDSGRDKNTAGAASFGTYAGGSAAISALFPTPGTGSITTQSRSIYTASGGDISVLAPGGSLTLQTTNNGNTLTPPGIITQDGGNVNIFTNGSVNLGISRIFTLRGGNIVIWSSTGDIAAGSSSKTVQSAPPTRVIIDPQSANVSTDLAGLATGGGIGVLATVAGIAPGNVDLIAPLGVVDAGDAGIRATGNLNIAATAVLNASNIAVSGASVGTPAAPVVSAPNISGIAAGNSTAGASNAAATNVAASASRPATTPVDEQPSIITVEVLGYGGDDQ